MNPQVNNSYGNTSSSINHYFEQHILGADPVELVRIVYRHAIKCVQEARAHLAGGRIMERAAAISRAYAAVSELQSALSPEAAPEITARLADLYIYIQQRLLDANLQQKDGPLGEAMGLLTTLFEAWEGVRMPTESQHGEGPTPIRNQFAGYGNEFVERESFALSA
jgi:flagellar protein FliS